MAIITTAQQISRQDILDTITEAEASNTYEQIEALLLSMFFGEDNETEEGFAYVGESENIVVKCKINGSGAPGSSTHNLTHGYGVFSMYCDADDPAVYMCVHATTSAATWIKIGDGGGGTLTVKNSFDNDGDPDDTYNTTQGYSELSIVKNTGVTPSRTWMCLYANDTTARWFCFDDVLTLSGVYEIKSLAERNTGFSPDDLFIVENVSNGVKNKVKFKYLYSVMLNFRSNLNASRDPQPTDDQKAGYFVASWWINRSATPNRVFWCVNSSLDGATWVELTGSGSGGSGANTVIGTDYPSSPEEGTIFIKKKA